MTSSYETIFNKFLGRVTDYDFLTIDEAYLWEQVSEWVENSIATPSLRVIFSSITCDKETQTLTYTLRNSAGDELSDQWYVEKLFAMSFVIQWLEPTVKNKVNLNQMFGGKEEKLRKIFWYLFTARYDWKRHSVSTRICWKAVKPFKLQRKDEICLSANV